jgi:hypothetical protein
VLFNEPDLLCGTLLLLIPHADRILRRVPSEASGTHVRNHLAKGIVPRRLSLALFVVRGRKFPPQRGKETILLRVAEYLEIKTKELAVP